MFPNIGHRRQSVYGQTSVAHLAIFVLCLALSGCGAAAFKTGTSTLSSGLTVSNPTVTFGSVPVGQSASGYVKLVNEGTSPVTISKLNFTGQSFSSSAQNSLPITIPASSTLNLGVQFNPATAGTLAGQLTVTASSNPTPLSVSLSGTGVLVLPPVLKALNCASTSLTSAGVTPCTVTLDGTASNDLVINLTSDNAAVSVPASVTISAGSSSSGFSATYSAVSSLQTANLTASFSGASQVLALQLNPLLAILDVSSLDLDFGTVNVDGSYSQPLILSSTGNAPVSIDSITITGPGFSIPAVTLPMVLNPGQSATLMVQLSPNAAGNVNGQITINDSSALLSPMLSSSTSSNSKKIRLSATAIPQIKQLSCATNTITGSGTNSCSVLLNAAAGTNGLGVALASSSKDVSLPASILVPAGATTAGFSASVADVTTTQTATLTASTSSSSKNFNLQLNAIVPTLAVSSQNLGFGNVSVNGGATQSLTLSSTGASAVTVSAAQVTGSGFSISGATFPLTLNPGQTAVLTAQFSPTVAGAASGQLTISSDSSTGSSTVVSLSGTGLPVLSGLSCAASSITGSGTDDCTVALNSAAAAGGFAVNLGSSNSSVSLPASVSVPAGSASVVFTAGISAVSTKQTAVITASANGITANFSLQLNPGALTLSANASSVSFGNVTLNTPTTQSITLTSTGTSAVTISAISISGTGFTVSGVSLPLTLNAGQSVILNVTFDPTVTGSQVGQLAIASNSSGGTIGIGLSGTGQSASHQVDLSWSPPASSPDPVVGYIVLRAPSGTSTYEQLNSTAVALTSYVDLAVQSGQSYDYMVKSVGASGNVSAPSNIASAVIP